MIWFIISLIFISFTSYFLSWWHDLIGPTNFKKWNEWNDWMPTIQAIDQILGAAGLTVLLTAFLMSL